MNGTRWSLALLCSSLIACEPAAEDCPDAGSVEDAGSMLSDAGSPIAIDAFDWLADPYVAARRLPGRSRLASSRFPEPPEGFDNHDFSHFVRIDGGEAVMFEAVGPGVVTRMWFTMRLEGLDVSPTDDARLHVYVDGEEIDFANGERGIRLADLTSGEHPAFPRPWAAGRDLSSDAIALFVPLHFQESMRLTLDHVPERTTYYHVDWRELPCEASVRSFDGTLSASQRAALDDATALWVDREERGEPTEVEVTLAPGESSSVDVTEPGVLRRVSLDVIDGDVSSLEASLVVDGVTIVDAPAHRWMFASFPAGGFASALSTGGPSGGSMEYPAPVRSSASLSVRNASAAPVTVTLRLGFDPGAPPEDLGSLAISCGAPSGPMTGVPIALSPLEGERGHYAGQFLVLRGREWGWAMMEGDHEVRVDGSYDHLGTGIEDYFGGAFYYLAGPFALPFAGAPGFDLMGREHLRAGMIDVAQYRHHLIDTINFEESFAFEYEVAAPNTTYEHCIYWYRDR